MTYSDVLRIRGFRDLWLGQAISQIGDALYYVSFMFMVKRLTGSAAMVGYTGAAEAVPYLLVMPYAGVLADRIDRKRILVGSDVLCALSLLAFAFPVLLGLHPAAWSILLLAFTLSSIRCFFMPAKSAAIPALVPADLVLKANALSATTFTVMQTVGLALSAVVVAPLYLASAKWFFFGTLAINACSFLGSAAFVSRLPKILPDRKDVHEMHPFRDFCEGLGFVRRRHDLMVLIALITVFRVAIAPFFVAYVVANDVWWGGPQQKGSPVTLAIVELTFFVGWLIATIWAAKIKALRPALWFCWGMAGIGVTIGLMAISPVVWVFCALNFAAGLMLPAVDLPINTYMQLSVEDAFRGRTSSVINTVTSSIAPIGMAMGGILVARFGLPATFAAMGAGTILSAIIGFSDPRFRNVRMPATKLVQEDLELATMQHVDPAAAG